MTTSPAHPARSDRDPEPDGPAKPKIELSAAQVLGGALAAMTAAFLGSRLSVAGTVVGAALASIVAAVGGSIYTASLRTTQEKVKTVFRGRVAGAEVPTTVETVSREDPAPAVRPPRVSRVSWKRIALAALAAFALAGVVLTGLELATGSALSGGKGTTISQVTEQDPAPKAKPTAAPTSASPTPSEETPTASTTPTPEPSASAPEPSATAPTPAATPAAPTTSASVPATPSTSSAPASPDPGADG